MEFQNALNGCQSIINPGPVTLTAPFSAPGSPTSTFTSDGTDPPTTILATHPTANGGTGTAMSQATSSSAVESAGWSCRPPRVSLFVVIFCLVGTVTFTW